MVRQDWDSAMKSRDGETTLPLAVANEDQVSTVAESDENLALTRNCFQLLAPKARLTGVLTSQ
jgi:hypothetical protein